MPTLPVILDVEGRFPPGSIRVRWHESAPPSHPRVEELKLAWPAHVAETARQGGILFNGPMIRCFGHHLEAGVLILDAGPTDYATFFCTNYLNHHLGDEIGWEWYANPIGISANVLTADGWVLYGLRNRRVACHPGCVHTFGGTVDPQDRDADGNLDVFRAMARELREELRLGPDRADALVGLGLIRDPQIRQPELIFDARVPVTRRELESALLADDDEHDAIVGCRDEPGAIERFLADDLPFVPVAAGALRLHARRLEPGA
jgi:8-oxo-dGTP pyrophosphatase MutT (NUDIX family)